MHKLMPSLVLIWQGSIVSSKEIFDAISKIGIDNLQGFYLGNKLSIKTSLAPFCIFFYEVPHKVLGHI